jgi:acetoin utilization deacetylase AcuC-like enzyme
VLVSAGFDAHADDPLADCRVTDSGYAAMASSIRSLAGELGVPAGVVLEGGYDLGALSRSLCDVLYAFSCEVAPAAPDVPIHPAAAEAQQRLAARWPALA